MGIIDRGIATSDDIGHGASPAEVHVSPVQQSLDRDLHFGTHWIFSGHSGLNVVFCTETPQYITVNVSVELSMLINLIHSPNLKIFFALRVSSYFDLYQPPLEQLDEDEKDFDDDQGSQCG